MTSVATPSAGAAKQPRTQPTLGSQRLRSIKISGGFLDGAAFDLAEGLNCLIGARGTGKSSVLELVRYALDTLPPTGDPERQRIENLVKANLRDGSIELTVETREGLTYRVIRAWQEDSVVVTADGAATQVSLRGGSNGVPGVFRAAIYSQNEIERIADQALSQLTLIDNFEAGQIAQITADLRTLTSKLATNATTLMPLQEQIDGLNGEIAGKDAIQEKLDALGPITGQNAEAVSKAQQAKSLRQRESQALDGLWQFMRDYDQQIDDLSGQISNRATPWLTREMLTGPNGEVLTGVKQAMLDGGAEIDVLLRQARDRLTKMQEALGDVGTSLFGTHAEQEAAYQDLIKHDAALRGQATERSRLEKMKNDLLDKQRQRDTLMEKQSGLQRERTQLLQKLSELRDQRYAVRTAIAKRINAALMPDIRVTIEQSGHLSQYRAMLEQVLNGARVQRGVVAQRIVERIMPAELVSVVRRGDIDGLVQRAGLKADQARKVADALKTTEALFTLETVELADRPRIELKDGESYKDSAALSTGQKCTTILPILLLDSDTPLLVDQPEDNLDNRFVCESVIKGIRQVKAARQLVFVTHNPNIPVLADAERVFVLESDGAHARKTDEGDVDECREAIVNLLEGGEQAFKRRQERYAY
ncbi:MAG: AAA family ATPase [Phycisphaeraceae bacterium]|nr:AAA family ATPase [Phycisphaeraceae bacterium]